MTYIGSLSVCSIPIVYVGGSAHLFVSPMYIRISLRVLVCIFLCILAQYVWLCVWASVDHF